MKTTSLLFSLLLMTGLCKSQITLEHSYVATGTTVQLNVVNLANSGYKYAYEDLTNQTVKLYNLNHSLWKTITLDVTSGYTIFNITNISESLFNTDASVEVLYYDGQYTTNPSGHFMWEAKVVNESGTVVLNLPNCSYAVPESTGANGWKLLATLNDATTGDPASNDVYSLPGNLPDMVLENGGNGSSPALSSPYPNPSRTGARIDYQLPAGINAGEMVFFNLNGQEIKRFKVDRTFATLELNTTDLPAGNYLYSLVTSGISSAAKKMVVIK